MKTVVILIFFAGLAPELMAETFSCSTFPRSTTFAVYSQPNSESVDLVVQHGLGVENAPIFQGIVTGFTLDHMKERFELAKRLGSLIQVSFNKEKCRFSDEKISCYRNEETKIGEQTVRSYAFYAHKEFVTNPYGEFESYRVSFEYRVGSYNYDQTMDFLTTDCLYQK